MRTSTLLTAAFAGVALSSPLVKRDTVMEIDTVLDVVYVTQIVTETAGAASATPEVEVTSVVAPTTSSSVVSASSSSTPEVKSFYEHRISWSSAWTSTYAVSPSVVASSLVATSSVLAVTSSSSVSIAPSSSEISATSSATVSAAETTSAAAAKATTYQQIVIAHHNVHRANHSASALTWSADLASTAASIAASCVYAHNVTANGGGYGQNIAAGLPASNVSAVITDLFYNGEVNNFAGLYGQANPDMSNFENWGHFSQLVWKATTQVGCATQDCSASGLANTGQYVSPYFTVCNYMSPGNYGGEYGAQIGDSLNKATVGWSYDL